jgi:hypothetical protein
LDASARLTAFSSVVDDQRMVRAERLERVYSCPGARRPPLLDRRVKAAWSAHQNRRPRAVDFVIRSDSVERCGWHISLLVCWT